MHEARGSTFETDTRICVPHISRTHCYVPHASRLAKDETLTTISEGFKNKPYFSCKYVLTSSSISSKRSSLRIIDLA